MRKKIKPITVKELIEELEEIEDKSMPVVIEPIDIDDRWYNVSSAVERYNFVEICTSFEKYSIKELDRYRH